MTYDQQVDRLLKRVTKTVTHEFVAPKLARTGALAVSGAPEVRVVWAKEGKVPKPDDVDALLHAVRHYRDAAEAARLEPFLVRVDCQRCDNEVVLNYEDA